jgi:hypothetical protein
VSCCVNSVSKNRPKLITSKRIAVIVSTALIVLLVTQVARTAVEQSRPGKVRFLLRIDPSIDPFVASGDPIDEQWIREHWWRMMVKV